MHLMHLATGKAFCHSTVNNQRVWKWSLKPKNPVLVPTSLDLQPFARIRNDSENPKKLKIDLHWKLLSPNF